MTSLSAAQRARGGRAGGYNPHVHVYNEETVLSIVAEAERAAVAEALRDAARDFPWPDGIRHASDWIAWLNERAEKETP